MAQRFKNLGVDWHLPGRKRPFTSTTASDNADIVFLAEQGLTVRDARAALRYPNPEQLAVFDGFEAAGYGNTTLHDLGVR